MIDPKIHAGLVKLGTVRPDLRGLIRPLLNKVAGTPEEMGHAEIVSLIQQNLKTPPLEVYIPADIYHLRVLKKVVSGSNVTAVFQLDEVGLRLSYYFRSNLLDVFRTSQSAYDKAQDAVLLDVFADQKARVPPQVENALKMFETDGHWRNTFSPVLTDALYPRGQVYGGSSDLLTLSIADVKIKFGSLSGKRIPLSLQITVKGTLKAALPSNVNPFTQMPKAELAYYMDIIADYAEGWHKDGYGRGYAVEYAEARKDLLSQSPRTAWEELLSLQKDNGPYKG